MKVERYSDDAVHEGAPFHPWAWLLWLGSALAAALVTQNPLYLTLVLLAALWVATKFRDENGPVLGLLRWAWVIPLFTAVANGLVAHAGETVLFVMPREVPLLGGPVTVEAVAFGFVAGFTLVTLLAVFAAFNAGADYYNMLRLVPGFLFQAGLVTGIALAFVPQTLHALDDIREAQQIRGHRFRGLRDLPPLFLPLLTMGLERSIQLAEAMESRGFGGVERGYGRAGARSLGLKLLLLAGLILIVVGIAFLPLASYRIVGILMAGTGVGTALISLGKMGRKIERSRYRTRGWKRRDRVLATASGILLIGLVATSYLEPDLFLFYPYPRIAAPAFDPIVGVALLTIALPAVLVPSGTTAGPKKEVEPYGTL